MEKPKRGNPNWCHIHHQISNDIPYANYIGGEYLEYNDMLKEFLCSSIQMSIKIPYNAAYFMILHNKD